MSTEEAKPIVLRSSDGSIFEMEEKFAMQSQTIKHMIDDGCADAEIPLPNVSSKTLGLVIEYCKCIVEEVDEEKKKLFLTDFVKVDREILFDLILAANYLNIKSLLDVTCQAVADNIKNKQPEEIRTMFNIKNDFTPEEEAAIRDENKWAFDQ